MKIDADYDSAGADGSWAHPSNVLWQQPLWGDEIEEIFSWSNKLCSSPAALPDSVCRPETTMLRTRRRRRPRCKRPRLRARRRS